MKILILNGSPSGEHSITLQTIRFVQKYFPKQSYEELHVAQKIRMFEKDFSQARKSLEEAELIIFCYPVYTFLVPAQLHRFLELIKENGVDLKGKFATQVTTSKHFYDVTAHEFIRENCLDLGLNYLTGLSADMEDLLGKKGRKEAYVFFHHLLWTIKQEKEGYQIRKNVKEAGTKKIVIVADFAPENDTLQNLIWDFQEKSPIPAEVVNLRDFPFAGGCLGCFHCASDGKCIYKDHFDEFLRDKIQTADACVYAFSIKDHSMGQRFKLFDDRQFCNGHRTVTMGKPVGYLIEGDYENEPNLRMVIEARAQVGGNYLAGVVWCKDIKGGESNGIGTTADSANGNVIGAGNLDHERPETEKQGKDLRRLGMQLAYCIRHHYNQPANFYGVGGLKIFRDLIFQMQGMMREDHRFYKEHGFYDFPQKRMGTILGMYLVGTMINNEKLRKKLGGNLTEGMLMPYKSVIDKAGSGKKDR